MCQRADTTQCHHDEDEISNCRNPDTISKVSKERDNLTLLVSIGAPDLRPILTRQRCSHGSVTRAGLRPSGPIPALLRKSRHSFTDCARSSL